MPRPASISISSRSMRSGLALGLVVVAQQMQHAMHHQMRDVIGQGSCPGPRPPPRWSPAPERHPPALRARRRKIAHSWICRARGTPGSAGAAGHRRRGRGRPRRRPAGRARFRRAFGPAASSSDLSAASAARRVSCGGAGKRAAPGRGLDPKCDGPGRAWQRHGLSLRPAASVSLPAPHRRARCGRPADGARCRHR